MSSNKLNTSKRNAVRLALVTGSTLAAIIGAQNLAALGAAPAAAIADSSAQQPTIRRSGDEDDDHGRRVSGVSVLRSPGQTSTTSIQQSSARRHTTRSSR